MNKKAVFVIAVVLISTIFISGCTSSNAPTGDVKTQDDVKKTVGDVSTDIENIQSVLDDIDKKLG
jgi:PBP1b-binding outer membrane lipoprotein LpoB